MSVHRVGFPRRADFLLLFSDEIVIFVFMSIRCLLERLERVSMLKAFVPFFIGILLAEHYALPGWFLVAGILIAGGCAVLFRSSVAAIALLLAVGFGTAQLRQKHRTVPRDVTALFDLRIEGIPSDRGARTSVEAEVIAWRDPSSDEWFAAGDRLMLYTDSLVDLQAGERIGCRGRIRDFRGGAASYRRLMRRRGFPGTLWVGERNLLFRRAPEQRPFHAAAAGRLARLGLSDRADALVRAMAAGDKSRLSPDLREQYARCGFSHLLAVSGLHTGIVFGLIYLLFGWLFLFRRGHLYYYVLSTAAIWLFVSAAGYPPSAVRAAVMCTFMQGALFVGREYVALNALAIAAFVMLLWRPAWAGDISFQLSFLAVFFLLVWAMPIQRRIRTHWRSVDTVIAAVVVSLVAGFATAPLVAYTFGMIPVAGLLLNPVAVLPAAVIILCGTVWMLVPVPFLAPLFRWCIEAAASSLDALARLAEYLPGTTVECRPDGTTTCCIYLLLLAATLAVWSVEPRKEKTLKRK